MMQVNPGQLRWPVEVQESTAQMDAVGNQQAEWHTVLKAMAGVNRLYGQEYWAAAAQGQQNTLTFVLRWSPALGKALQGGDLARWQILFDGQAYAIQSADDMGFRHKLVKLRAVMK